ncbi:MAG: hypothetical protein EI684_02260 [Candidatus Viridilinea halotolerans]|uniref:Uncharacterized protein n=1 Tax=Candidatus Viridilinea halotolerans TaxID=2491704 RepID=A0A426U981_9CHLR|nr:MAG: hypothetical protein EI684_02260 [Candidatus Viridilinea halotolerans]
MNAIASKRIPLTNNTTELVIRRFAQHYQNFCVFDRIATAERYLTVFEWCAHGAPLPRSTPRLAPGARSGDSPKGVTVTRVKLCAKVPYAIIFGAGMRSACGA